MYAKLFRGNIKKALRDYVIYFFTLVISSTLFFAFLSLTSRYNDILGGNGNYSLALFQNTIRYAVLAISIIFVALVRYINHYKLKQRSREFSVYMIYFFILNFSKGTDNRIVLYVSAFANNHITPYPYVITNEDFFCKFHSSTGY